MKRYDIINALIEKYGYKRYLEVGLARGECFREIVCEHKDSVDPNVPEATYQMTSDEFFSLPRAYDIIFIDGLHERDQVWNDAINAMDALEDGGCVVFHDCNPASAFEASEKDNGTVWMGTVYQAIPDIRVLGSWECVDTDCGVGILRKAPSTMDYAYFDAHRNEILNLVSPEAWKP
jgi:hypothetical protein